MTKHDVQKIKNVLEHIKQPHSGHVQEAIAICDRQLAIYKKTKGQIKDQYETERWPL